MLAAHVPQQDCRQEGSWAGVHCHAADKAIFGLIAQKAVEGACPREQVGNGPKQQATWLVKAGGLTAPR